MKINYKQLAFILDIEPVKALEKILYVYHKTSGKDLPYSHKNAKGYLFNDDGKRNNLPESMDIGLLAQYLNLPTLQNSVEDIQNNYLNRPATKKWILCDYPERELKRCSDNDRPFRIPFPKALETLLPVEISDTIREEWKKRFPKARVV